MQRRFTRMLTLMLAAAVMSTTLMSATLPAPVSTEPAPATVKAAVNEFNSLSKKEKKERLKEVKKVMKQYKAEKKAGMEPSTNTILLVILAILLPPLAVFLHQGEINSKFWISLLLTLLFFVPGVIYALIVILGDGAVKASPSI
jgi:uncharacterized membrane protein YqaE (UPF0057 family)